MKVYVVSAGRTAHKIGTAKNVARRMVFLQTGSPTRIRALHEEDVSDELAPHVEGYAHWLLREQRTTGEWFKVDADTAIAAVVSAHQAVLNGERVGRKAGGRPRIYADERMMLRLPNGWMERIRAVLYPRETLTDFIRDAIKRELNRRQRSQKKAA